MKMSELLGSRIGRWFVVKEAARRGSGRYFLCVCDCGSKKEVSGSSLAYGGTSSCGCFAKENPPRRTHGMTKTPTYNSWVSMHQRCSPAWREARFYHERGIIVCARWKDFEAFFSDMGTRPEGKTLDRIDNDLGYEPGNCRWASPKEQAKNRRPRSCAKLSDRAPGKDAHAHVEIEAV